MFKYKHSLMKIKASYIVALLNGTNCRFAEYKYQGWISYTGTHVPVFVTKLGLIKPGKASVCPQLWAFA